MRQKATADLCLSRVDINLAHVGYEDWRRNMEEVHADLIHCVTPGIKVLFRMEDEDDRRAVRSVIVQTTGGTPDWEHLSQRRNGMIVGKPLVKEASVEFGVGETFGFRLLGNAVRRRGRRVRQQYSLPQCEPIKDFEGQAEWLKRQGDLHGFRVQGFQNNGAESIPVKRKNGSSFSVWCVRYDGILVVTDPAKFANAVKNGIGRCRSFGCGLLSLRMLAQA